MCNSLFVKITVVTIQFVNNVFAFPKVLTLVSHYAVFQYEKQYNKITIVYTYFVVTYRIQGVLKTYRESLKGMVDDNKTNICAHMSRFGCRAKNDIVVFYQKFTIN